MFFDQRVNWKYQTEPDPGINGRRSYWPRGKVVGGSSSINAMVYIRGQREDYDGWRDLGNPGWGWDEVLPYFRRSETFAGGADAFRGGDGPLHVSDPSAAYHPLCRQFIAAGQQLGFAYNPDFNGASQEGVGFYQITTRNGRRMSAARAFLHPALRRPNCELVTHAHASRLLFDGRRASGVEFIERGHRHRVSARREIIVSAGAINSPQLLQLSGIGDPALLREHGIDSIAPLPGVGRNLQDHVDYCLYYRATVPTLNNLLAPWWRKLLLGAQYLVFRNGLLSLSVNQAGGFVRGSPARTRPNLQLYFNAISYTSSPAGKRPLLHPDPWPGFHNSAGLTRPASRGSLHIASANPLQPVRIHPNYLSVDDDVEQMLEGARLLRRLAETPALKAVIAEETLPGPGVRSDQQLIDDIRARCTTVFHPCGTCKMGPDPRDAVVDAACRVHGIERLRVVDASIFPTLISGNTNAPAMMVAEKAADLVLAEHAA